MSKDTLKEREDWEDDFDNLQIIYQTPKGNVKDNISLLDDETTDTIKTFISTLIEQTKKEMSDKIIEQAEKETDYKKKSGLYEAYDIINNVNQDEKN